MAGWISYKDQSIAFNNRQFSSTMNFVVEVAEKIANENEKTYVERVREEMVTYYYPGLCIDIEVDFPKIEERKFWAMIFCETAREIFERKIGNQDYSFWQTQRIYQIYGSGDLFVKAVKDVEPSWFPYTRDHREFDDLEKRKSQE